jgi:tetraacyldisaccharide 4'-kinase
VTTRAFPDHHPFTRAEIEAMIEEARGAGLKLATTEKDLVRLPGLDAVDADMIRVLPIAIVFEDEARLRELVAERLKRARE